MDYQQALAQLRELAKFGVNPGLQRIEALLARLGSPERCFAALHIGGTNGKGSVAALCESIARAAGRKTGLFTSPHLHSHRERYRLNGQPMAEAVFAAAIESLLPEMEALLALGAESPTEFELATALAFQWFTAEQVDLAVVEVGLGGSIDSTNVLPAEQLVAAVLTNVSRDHLAYLGESIEEIAAVKAGIIKLGCPVVSGARGAAAQVIARRAAELQAPLYQLGREIHYQVLVDDPAGQRLRIQTAGREYPQLFLPLLGAHQAANAALAVQAMELAGCPPEAVAQGLSQVRWPARLEVLSPEPLVLLDGAHNPAGMRALRQALDHYWPERPVLAVLGMFADKEREEALQELLPRLQRVILTPPPNPLRAGETAPLARFLRAEGRDCQEVGDPAAALALARQQQQAGELLLLAGSLHLAGELRALFYGLEQER